MMHYTLHLSKESLKFLKKHPDLKPKFINAFRMMTEDFDVAFVRFDVKKLRGAFLDTYRLRLGKYRAIFRIINDRFIIYVIQIGSRGDVYK